MRLALWGLGLLFWAEPARAHGNLPGGAGFFAGFAHPFVTLEHLFCLIGVGLLLGRGSAPAGSRTHALAPQRVPIAALALGIAAGLVMGATGLHPGGDVLARAVLALALVAGLWLAGAFAVPAGVKMAMAALAGVLTSLDTDLPPLTGADSAANLTPYAGVVAGILVIALDAMALASVARKPVFGIALRVAGSWIAAIALMILALSYRSIAA